MEAEVEWGVKIVAVCTDASGESRKARKLLKAKLPHLVTPDCYVHQVNGLIEHLPVTVTQNLTTFRSTSLLATSSNQLPL